MFELFLGKLQKVNLSLIGSFKANKALSLLKQK